MLVNTLKHWEAAISVRYKNRLVVANLIVAFPRGVPVTGKMSQSQRPLWQLVSDSAINEGIRHDLSGLAGAWSDRK